MKTVFYFLISIYSVALALPRAGAAATYQRDLGLESITLGKKELYAGEKIRLYARVVNYGVEDEIAYVNFWQGGTSVDNSQPVSLRADGFPDEVFVDYTIPDQPFNIRTVVKGHTAGDENPSNDELVTTLFTPIPDRDRDRVADERDNCPDTANADQEDTDQDGQGNLCDSDDDNDGIADAKEQSNGTNPLSRDSDGDSVDDATDLFPTDSSRSAKPVAKTAPPPPQPLPQSSDAPAETTPTAPDSEIGESPSPSESASDEPSLGDEPPTQEIPETLSPPLRTQSPQASPKPSSQSGGIPEQIEEQEGFWNFGNPYLKGLLAMLMIGAGGLLIAERKITRKYLKLISPEEEVGTETVTVSEHATESTEPVVASPVKKKPKQIRMKKKKLSPKSRVAKLVASEAPVVGGTLNPEVQVVKPKKPKKINP